MSTQNNTPGTKKEIRPEAKRASNKKSRKAYARPELRKHEKLPVITAGSISESDWFQDPS